MDGKYKCTCSGQISAHTIFMVVMKFPVIQVRIINNYKYKQNEPIDKVY